MTLLKGLRKPRLESKTCWCVFDYASRLEERDQLERAAEDPELWNDPERAQTLMRRLARLRQELEGWNELEQKIRDALELAELGDESMRTEIEAELATIDSELERREFRALLSGRYDANNAILAIHAGPGGSDSQDWALMLERMYLRWAEASGYQAEILDRSEGEEAGIKSVTVAMDGEYAYGYLRSEKGVHRLVRLSPFDSAHRRHTSFALVEVLPQVEAAEELDISASDLKIDTFRSAGAGGQNVQKNETAVRITHIPTGIVVTCQNERSQNQNKETALRVLRARLLELKQEQHAEEIAELRGDYVQAEWGSQIRSYVLHPYQLVKDHRTELEVGNTQAVLDGALDSFIEAYLRESIGVADRGDPSNS